MVGDSRYPAKLAAAGVLAASNPDWYAFRRDTGRLVEALREVLLDREGTVHWKEPDYVVSSLADAWEEAVRSRPPVQLEAELTRPSRLARYADALYQAPNVEGLYVYTAPGSAYLNWRWPLRMGFLPDPGARALRHRFDAWLPGNGWAHGIMEPVDTGVGQPTVEFLFLPDARHALRDLEAAPLPVMANCVFTFGDDKAALKAFTEAAPRLRALTQAKGLIFAQTTPAAFEGWLYLFFHELAHNRPLDAVLRYASVQITGSPTNAILFGSRFFIEAVKPSALARRLVGQLAELYDADIELDNEMAGHLHMAPGLHPAYKVGAELQRYMGEFQYESESEETTTDSKLTVAAEKAAAAAGYSYAAPGERGMESMPAPRFLQQQMADDTLPDSPPAEVLTAEHSYHLTIRIGPEDKGWGSAGQAFPEDELPKDERGHMLTVVLTEPNHLPKPQVGTLFLPASGTSSTCDFRFRVSPAYDRFEARVLVLYANRVLQTALLCSPVSKPGAPVPAGGIEFKTEAVVRPVEASLEGRTSYDATFFVDRASDGKPVATSVRGMRAVPISLAGLQETTAAITSLFNASDWEGKPFDRLDSKETLELLRNLALHGAKLHRTLAREALLPEQLLGSAHIQVVTTREDYHLPIEFCYSRRAPKSTAALCPHAVEQLCKEEIGTGCTANCTTREHERDYVCPMAFWGLNRVIESQRPRPDHREELAGAEYGLRGEPADPEDRLTPLTRILVGASDRIGQDDVKRLKGFIEHTLKVQPVQATSWDEWEAEVEQQKPGLLLLMVHTDTRLKTPSMEINGEFLDPPDIDESRVVAPDAGAPLVLLLGCGTRIADVPSHSLAAEFRVSGAGIVVSTLAELLDTHAPRLAEALLAELARPAPGPRSFGEVMLAVKRKGLLEGLPIALALVAYGDADWRL